MKLIDHRLLKLRNRKLIYLFAEYLIHHRGVGESTISSYYLRLRRFLHWIECKKLVVTDLTTRDIQQFFSTYLKRKTRDEKKQVITAVRGFLKFLFLKEIIKLRLDIAVPEITLYKKSRVPHYLTRADIEKLLKAPDQKIESGRRDYLMLLLLARYGVRLLSAKKLLLKNIDWKKKLITFPALKNGKSVTVPLLPDVARAVLNYIKKDRSTDKNPELFLTIKDRGTGGKSHARRALSYCNHMSQFKDYYKKTGIKSPQKASHILRHSFATHLIQDGKSIKTISDLLGHTGIDTTQIYTKVDVESLRSITSPWPVKA